MPRSYTAIVVFYSFLLAALDGCNAKSLRNRRLLSSYTACEPIIDVETGVACVELMKQQSEDMLLKLVEERGRVLYNDGDAGQDTPSILVQAQTVIDCGVQVANTFSEISEGNFETVFLMLGNIIAGPDDDDSDCFIPIDDNTDINSASVNDSSGAKETEQGEEQNANNFENVVGDLGMVSEVLGQVIEVVDIVQGTENEDSEDSTSEMGDIIGIISGLVQSELGQNLFGLLGFGN